MPPAARCSPGPSTTSASTSSPACSPSSSPTSCAAAPPRPDCTCPSAPCSANWPASARPSCSTPATGAGPGPTACSPTPPPSRTSSPASSAFTGTLPDDDMGNTPNPPQHHADHRKHKEDQLIQETPPSGKARSLDVQRWLLRII